MPYYKDKRKCSLCNNYAQAYNMCSKHYTRWRRFGDPLYLTPIKIKTYSDPMTCVDCKKVLPLSQYYRQHVTGYYNHCKSCHALRNRKNNSDAYKLTRCRWATSSKGKLSKHLNYLHRKAKGLTQLAAERFRQNSKDKLKAIKKRYSSSEKGRESRIKSYAIRRSKQKIASNFTLNNWKDILKEFKHSCAYCGRADLPLTRDHVTPIARGGHHTKENIVPACQPCNLKKRDKLLALFY